MNILIVEDDKMLLRALSNELTTAGYLVYAAEDGSKATDIMSDNKIDLIICDLMMPVISGAAFLSLLKGYFNRSTPVIVMSTLNNGAGMLKNMDIDYIAFFEKPFVLDVLINTINNYKREHYETNL